MHQGCCTIVATNNTLYTALTQTSNHITGHLIKAMRLDLQTIGVVGVIQNFVCAIGICCGQGNALQVGIAHHFSIHRYTATDENRSCCTQILQFLGNAIMDKHAVDMLNKANLAGNR